MSFSPERSLDIDSPKQSFKIGFSPMFRGGSGGGVLAEHSLPPKQQVLEDLAKVKEELADKIDKAFPGNDNILARTLAANNRALAQNIRGQFDIPSPTETPLSQDSPASGSGEPNT